MDDFVHSPLLSHVDLCHFDKAGEPNLDTFISRYEAHIYCYGQSLFSSPHYLIFKWKAFEVP